MWPFVFASTEVEHGESESGASGRHVVLHYTREYPWDKRIFDVRAEPLLHCLGRSNKRLSVTHCEHSPFRLALHAMASHKPQGSMTPTA